MKTFLAKTLKVARWVIYIAAGLFILLMAFIEIFDRYLASERGARWLYDDVPHQPVTLSFTPSGVRYLSIGDVEKPPLLLIHGAPGGFYDWKSFSMRERIYDKYRLLIVERPGYGGTRPRGAEPSIEVQAQRILEALENEKRPAVVMGHSYGSPIAVIMGAMAPERIEKIIGVSGQYDPDNEITFSVSYLIQYKIFRYLLPRYIWVSNVEKLAHPEALREIEPLYGKVKVPVILIHGDADTLVPYENSPFLMKFLKKDAELITLEGKDHPLHMQIPDFLVDFLLPGEGITK